MIAQHLYHLTNIDHPQTFVGGWRQARGQCCCQGGPGDHSKHEEVFREDQINNTRTTLSSKILSQHKDFFSKLAVDAVLRLKGLGNLDAIQILRMQGGIFEDSFLVWRYDILISQW